MKTIKIFTSVNNHQGWIRITASPVVVPGVVFPKVFEKWIAINDEIPMQKKPSFLTRLLSLLFNKKSVAVDNRIIVEIIIPDLEIDDYLVMYFFCNSDSEPGILAKELNISVNNDLEKMLKNT
jgi:hypothetical protein